VPDIFDEVEEDLRADQARALFKRYGWLALVVVGLIIVGVGGWEAWQARQLAARQAEASLFLEAQRQALLGAPTQAQRDAALAGFERVAAEAGQGYRALAQLNEALLKDQTGDHDGAQALWSAVAANPANDQLLHDIATLAAVTHAAPDADANALRNKIGPLTAPTNPFRALALEQTALLDLRTGDTAHAKETLRAIFSDTAAPDPVRGRANALLQRLDG